MQNFNPSLSVLSIRYVTVLKSVCELNCYVPVMTHDEYKIKDMRTTTYDVAIAMSSFRADSVLCVDSTRLAGRI